jgi:hypothetical protein
VVVASTVEVSASARSEAGPLQLSESVSDRVYLRPMHLACRAIATCSPYAISSAITTTSPYFYHYMTPSRLSSRAYSATASRPPTLPRLPVPDLHRTLSKYLQSLAPLLQEDEARGGTPWRSALQERQRWVDEFEKGLGAKCQERLHGKCAE